MRLEGASDPLRHERIKYSKSDLGSTGTNTPGRFGIRIHMPSRTDDGLERRFSVAIAS
jgi:hypothetical protein